MHFSFVYKWLPTRVRPAPPSRLRGPAAHPASAADARLFRWGKLARTDAPTATGTLDSITRSAGKHWGVHA